MSLPTAKLVANGIDVTTEFLKPGGDGKKPLVSLTITDEPGIKSDACEIVVDNRDGFLPPAVGSTLKVWLGYAPDPIYMGKYRVDRWTVSGPPKLLTISAKSAELTTDIRRVRSRSHHETTVGAIVAEVARRHGLAPAIDAEVGSDPIEHIDQSAESDVAFLTRLAQRHGATFKVADGKLIFAKKGSDKLPSGAPKPDVKVTPRDVSTWSVTRAERGGHLSAEAHWHDHDAGIRRTVVAGKGEPRHVDRRTYRTEAEAKAAATAQLSALTRGRLTGEIDGVGNPDIIAEGVVTLEGFDPSADGKFFAKTVTHSFSASGYTTSVSLETTKSDPEEIDG